MVDFVKNRHVKHLRQQNAGSSDGITYQIKTMRRSESAVVFFAHSQNETGQQVVIKMLRSYKDTRFDQEDSRKRLESQIEALQWNPRFTPGIYLGLGQVVAPNLETIKEKLEKNALIPYIKIKNVCNDVQHLPAKPALEAEYALIMYCLPKERRLDYLLRQRKIEDVQELLRTLVERVFSIHEVLSRPSDFHLGDRGEPWGSYEQLKKKLLHNIGLFDNLKQLEDSSAYTGYFWLKDELYKIINDQRWEAYFTARVRSHHIKRCHGDLKARNIWIASKESENQLEQRVRILDAIDFNSAYCNIDVLSDIAMLAVDVQANYMQLHEHNGLGKRGYELANLITDTYLEYAEQKDDKTAKIVLAYYMLEKAIVRASVSLFYDRNESPQLGIYFLDIAVERIEFLKSLLVQIGDKKLALTPLETSVQVVHSDKFLPIDDKKLALTH